MKNIISWILLSALAVGCATGSSYQNAPVVYNPKANPNSTAATSMSVFEAKKIVQDMLSHSRTTKTRNGQSWEVRYVIDAKGIADPNDPSEGYRFGSSAGPVVVTVPGQRTVTKNGASETFDVDVYQVRYNAYAPDAWVNGDTQNEATQFVDAVLVLEKYFTTDHTDEIARELTQFETTAKDYRAHSPRPAISEETRKYQVLAENAFDEKRYDEAARLYQKALDISSWWPAGHYNLALIYAQQEYYPDAYKEMKKYLALVPDSPDARKARDKLYVWESKLQGMSRR